MRWHRRLAATLSCTAAICSFALLGPLPARAAVPGLPANNYSTPNCTGGPTNPNGSPCGADGVNKGLGDPINAITGNNYQREVDLVALPGVLGLEIVRHYNSASSGREAERGILGRGWRLSYDASLQVEGSRLTVTQPDGSTTVFVRGMLEPQRWQSDNPLDGSVSRRETGRGAEFLWRQADGREWLFDLAGRLVQISVPTGEFLSLQRDAKGLLVKVTDPQGRSLHLNYLDRQAAAAGDRYRGVQSIDSPVGRFVYVYGSAPGKDKSTLANLVQVQLPTHYDADRKAHAYADRGTSTSSLSRSYHYEDPRFPTLLTGISVSGQGSDGQPVNRRIATWTYAADGRANMAVRGEPARLKLGADGKPLQPARLAEGTGADQVVLERGAGRSVVINHLGEKTTYRHATIDGQDRLLEVMGAGCARCTAPNQRFSYDATGRLIAVTRLDAAGTPLETTTTERDTQGRVSRTSRIAYVAGQAQAPQWQLRYEYPSPSAIQPSLIARPSVIDGREHLSRIEYNAAGQPMSVSESGYSPLDTTPISRTSRYRYETINGRSLLSEAEGPLPGDLTRYRYDAPGNRVIEIDGPLGSKTVLQYDSAGRVIERTGPDGIVEALGYDPQGRLTRVARAGTMMRLGYDASGQVSEVQDALGQHLALRYDAAGRLVELRDMQGNRIAWVYTPQGSLRELQLLDPDGTLSQRKMADTPLDAGMTDLAATLAAEIGKPLPADESAYDAQGRRTLYEYDDFGRRVVETSPVTGRMTLRYDAADRLIEKTASDGGRTLIVRDALGRATRVQAEGEDARIEWGPQNRPLRISYKEGEERFAYDANARLTEHTRLIDGHRFVTRYAYDALGRMASKTLPDGQVLGYRYNGAMHAKPGVLAGIVREGLIDVPIVSDLNRPEERFADRGFSFGNGLSHHRVLDSQGRPIEVGSAQAGQSRLRWDDGAGRSGQADPQVTYGGAESGAVLPAESARRWQAKWSFTLGQLGTGPTAKAQALSVLIPETVADQRFDSRGRLVEDAQRRYVWDGMDRLVEVRAKQGDGSDSLVARYRYNVFGERIAKVVYAGGNAQGKVSYFFYDGSELTAEADASGQVTREYVHIDSRPVAMLEGRAVLAIHTDDRLAPLAVTDKDRRVVWQARLGNNGDAAVAPGSVIDMPLRGSNQYFDAETGLHYNTHRYLDAQAGRYISPDPMGLAAGPDLYRFALGQPHRFVDPLGLAPAVADVKLTGLPAAGRIADLSMAQKLGVVFQSAIPLVPGEIGEALLAAVNNLPTIAGVMAAWMVLQAVPFVGEAVDVLIAGAAWYQFGSSAIDLIKGLLQLVDTLNSAQCENDLRRGAVQLVTTVESLLKTAAFGYGSTVATANAAKRVSSLWKEVIGARKAEGALADYEGAKPKLQEPDVRKVAVVDAAIDELEAMDATIAAEEAAAAAVHPTPAPAPYPIPTPAPPPTPKRVSWQQSEKDVGQMLGTGWLEQVSYKLNSVTGRAEEVPRGTKGSVRPDFCNATKMTCAEVKNYNLLTNRDRLIKVISEQAIVRAKNLPQGYKQEIWIDVRGQSLSAAEEIKLIGEIVRAAGGSLSRGSINILR